MRGEPAPVGSVMFSVDLDHTPMRDAIEQLGRELTKYADLSLEAAIRQRCSLPADMSGRELLEAIKHHELTMISRNGADCYYLDGDFLVGTSVLSGTRPGHIEARIVIYQRA